MGTFSHMAFRGKVDDGAGLVRCQQAGYQGAVTDVAVHKQVACIALQAGHPGSTPN